MQEDDHSRPIGDCRSCRFKSSLLLMEACIPGDCCVQVESGRQIDRFFRRNPHLATQYLNDVFWERRAIAVRYAPVERLSSMINDPDEAVRRAVAYRLPREQLVALMNDSDREVRITVADRLPVNLLEAMANDEDYLVRAYLAQRLPVGRLFRLMRDSDRQVRKWVAKRLPEESLGLMLDDPEPEIRRLIAERLSAEELALLLHDADWTVRLAAVLRAPLAMLHTLKNEEHDPEVSAAIEERLNTNL